MSGNVVSGIFHSVCWERVPATAAQQHMPLVTSHYVKSITSIQYTLHVHVGWCGTHVQYLLVSLILHQPIEFQRVLYFHVPWHITMVPGTCKILMYQYCSIKLVSMLTTLILQSMATRTWYGTSYSLISAILSIWSETTEAEELPTPSPVFLWY